MWKWIKRLFFAAFCLALLGGGVYAGGYLLPAQARLESTISVDSEAEHVFALFHTAEGLASWWPASGKRGFDDFTATHSGGPKEGPGMEMTFRGAGRVLGVQTIRSSKPNEEVVYDMDYLQFRVTRTIELNTMGPLTTISWIETATLEQPVLRYFALFSESQVEGEITVALDEVKKAAEPMAATARAAAKEESERVEGEKAAVRDAEDEARRAKNTEDLDNWQYTQEEAPTPIDISAPIE